MRSRLSKLESPRRARSRAAASLTDAKKLHQQSLLLDVALNTMSQGLVMFDAAERVVLANERYSEISGLSPDFVKPGRTLREILHARQAQGNLSQDIESYRHELLDELARGTAKTLTVSTTDGRKHRVTSVPMADGGWVATHEDITEQVTAEAVIEKQKRHLDAALANMSQGLSMFDAAQRLTVCNRQYAEFYNLPPELTQPGTPVRAILEYRVAAGNVLNDIPNYVEHRIRAMEANKPYRFINRMPGGRMISVLHRPMADGGWVTTHEDVTDTIRREESFRLLFESSPVPMWVSDQESMQFLAVNDAAIAHYGYSRDEFLSMTVADVRLFADRRQAMHFLRNLSKDELLQHSGRHAKADGTLIDVCVYSRALPYEGHSARLAAILDITTTKRTEDELNRTKNFLNTVIEHVPVPIVVTDIAELETESHNYRFTLFNRAYEDLTGSSREQIIGKTAHEIYPAPLADSIVEAGNETLRSDKVVSTEVHPVQTHKGTRMVTAKKTIVRDEQGKAKYLLTVLDDVTERQRAEMRISYLAHNDSLTDLPNRATFVEYLDKTRDEAFRAGTPFTILWIDLDHFKEANDVYGHLIGDSLLREAARRLKATAGNAFLARVGGDEFTLIVTDGPQPAAARALGERLIAAFQEEFEIDGHRLHIGLTIGGAIHPTNGTDATALLANADAALYQAKSEMRGTVRFFEPELGLRLRERRELQDDLRAAIDSGDLFLNYQPLYKIALNEPIGFEALVRWQCKKRGVVRPDRFIPIAEESRLIVPLGEWVLREACREAASWPQPLNISVNISPVQFHHSNLPQIVHAILLETGLKPSRLELEITEGVLIDDFARAITMLRQLKALGVRIAMDDFGSGYSSLSYLHAFPFEKIKIDRTFIGDVETNRQSMAIVRAIITLGHSLSIPVLAEGVETEGQRRFLAQEQCDELQGYLTGRPLPIDRYAALIGRVPDADRADAAG
jgi:diguanylate cyclase (GGDEF)-like protein/PAS domain S-box-containing protein